MNPYARPILSRPNPPRPAPRKELSQVRVSIAQAPAKLPELALRAHSDGEVVITKYGQPSPASNW